METTLSERKIKIRLAKLKKNQIINGQMVIGINSQMCVRVIGEPFRSGKSFYVKTDNSDRFLVMCESGTLQCFTLSRICDFARRNIKKI